MKHKINGDIKAFSLIELSIVILIIGLIIAGVIGGRKLITLSNLSKARALTNSSPVAGIEDLALWLESTSKASFDSVPPADGSAVANWNDINTQQTVKNNATPGNAPTYITNSTLNNLPAVRFNGSSNYLLGNTVIGGTKLTAFIVTSRIAITASTGTFSMYPSGATYDWTSQSAFLLSYHASDGSGLLTLRDSANKSTGAHPGNGKTYVFATVFDGTNNIAYLNGAQLTTVASPGTFNISKYIVGARLDGSIKEFYNGDIGEIIVFSRDLSDFERQQIERYLAKKWGIALA